MCLHHCFYGRKTKSLWLSDCEASSSPRTKGRWTARQGLPAVCFGHRICIDRLLFQEAGYQSCLLDFTPYKLGKNLEIQMNVNLPVSVIHVTGKNGKGPKPGSSSSVPLPLGVHWTQKGHAIWQWPFSCEWAGAIGTMYLESVWPVGKHLFRERWSATESQFFHSQRDDTQVWLFCCKN